MRHIRQLSSYNCTLNGWSIMNSLKLRSVHSSFCSSTWKLSIYIKKSLPFCISGILNSIFYLLFFYRLFIYKSRMVHNTNRLNQYIPIWGDKLVFFFCQSLQFLTAVAAVVATRERKTFISFKLNKKSCFMLKARLYYVLEFLCDFIRLKSFLRKIWKQFNEESSLKFPKNFKLKVNSYTYGKQTRNMNH